MITKEQCDFLKKIAATGKDGLKPDMKDYKISNMVGYFDMCGFISNTAKSVEWRVIQPAGEAAIEEYESEQKKIAQSEKSYKASLISAKASAFAALFAGLLLLATVVFGVINAVHG